MPQWKDEAKPHGPVKLKNGWTVEGDNAACIGAAPLFHITAWLLVIPAIAANREIEAGLLKRLDVEGFDLTVDYGLFYPRGRLFSGAAEAFLATLGGLGIFSHGENLQGHPWKSP